MGDTGSSARKREYSRESSGIESTAEKRVMSRWLEWCEDEPVD